VVYIREGAVAEAAVEAEGLLQWKQPEDCCGRSAVEGVAV
jgi:hypothetical protein